MERFFSAGLSLTVALALIYLGTLVLFMDRKNKAYLVFHLFCMAASAVSFMDFMARNMPPNAVQEAGFWLNMLLVTPIILVLVLNFSMEYTGFMNRKNRIVIYTVLYISFLVYLVFAVLLRGIQYEISWMPWGYAIKGLTGNKTLVISFVIWMVLLTAMTYIVLIKAYKDAIDAVNKSQALNLIVAFSLPIVLGMVQNILRNLFGVQMAQMQVPATLIMAAFIYRGIKKYSLFSINPVAAAESMFRLLQSFIILTDTERMIISVNPSACAALGYEEQDLVGKDVCEIFGSDNVFRNETVCERLAHQHRITNLDMELRTKNGRNLRVVLSVTTIKNDEEVARGFLFTAMDISERIRLEDSLRDLVMRMESTNEALEYSKKEIADNYAHLQELDKMKQNFIAIVSHELRTPLTSIKGFLSFLLMGAAGKINDQQKDFLLSIQSNSERLLKLINELLDISKIESGTFSVSKKIVNVNTVAAEAAKEMSSIAAARRITLELSLPEGPLSANVDDYRVAQVMINLLNNSMKFSHAETVITLCVEGIALNDVNMPEYLNKASLAGGDYVLVRVTDQGVGMEPDKAQKVFDKFYQIEDPDTRRHQGIGLGLNIAKNIVEAHGGRIWAESNGRGQGAVFSFVLPA